MACTLCQGAMPDDEWCRACGEGLPEPEPQVEPMTGLAFALRWAHGGPLSTDGPAARAAYNAAIQLALLEQSGD